MAPVGFVGGSARTWCVTTTATTNGTSTGYNVTTDDANEIEWVTVRNDIDELLEDLVLPSDWPRHARACDHMLSHVFPCSPRPRRRQLEDWPVPGRTWR